MRVNTNKVRTRLNHLRLWQEKKNSRKELSYMAENLMSLKTLYIEKLGNKYE